MVLSIVEWATSIKRIHLFRITFLHKAFLGLGDKQSKKTVESLQTFEEAVSNDVSSKTSKKFR